MSLSRAAGSKMASALVLMLCAALFAVLRVGADTIRAREVPGAGDPDTLASATIEWAESRPFDQSGIDARFVSVLAESDGVERLAGQTSLELGARSAGRELKARIVLVQGNLFETLGVRLATGTSKTSAREAVISDAFWRRAFDGRPDIIGLQFQLHGRSMNDDPWTALTVVGVASPGFAGIRPDQAEDIWLSWAGWPNVLLPDTETEDFVARAAPLNVTLRVTGAADLRQISFELSQRAERVGLFKPGEARIAVTPGAGSSVSTWTAFQQRSRLFVVLFALLLMIGCSSISASVALQRAQEQKEDSIRMALGEAPVQRFARIVRAAAWSTVIPAALGVAGAAILFQWLKAVDDDRLVWLMSQFEWAQAAPVLLGSAFWVSVSTCALMLLTRWLFRRVGQRIGLGDRGSTPTVLLFPVGVGILGVLAVVVVSTGVLWQLRQLQARDFGFSPETVHAASIIPRSGDNKQSFARMLAARSAAPLLSQLNDLPPGSVALATASPFAIPLVREMKRFPESVQVFVNEVTASYFDVFNLQVRAGRRFAAEASDEVVVSEQFARRYLADGSAVGARLRLGGLKGGIEELVVVGVVPDIQRITAKDPTAGVIYRPLLNEGGLWTVLAKPDVAQQMAISVTQYLADSGQGNDWVLAPMRPLSERVEWAYRAEWLEVKVLMWVALALIAVALYSVVATLRSLLLQRGREMAVRRCLGAPTASLLTAAVGLAPSAVAAFLLGGLLLVYGFARLLLPEVSERSLLQAACVALGLLVAGWLSTLHLALSRRLEAQLMLRLNGVLG